MCKGFIIVLNSGRQLHEVFTGWQNFSNFHELLDKKNLASHVHSQTRQTELFSQLALINPLTPGAFRHKHIFWTFSRFSAWK